MVVLVLALLVVLGVLVVLVRKAKAPMVLTELVTIARMAHEDDAGLWLPPDARCRDIVVAHLLEPGKTKTYYILF